MVERRFRTDIEDMKDDMQGIDDLEEKGISRDLGGYDGTVRETLGGLEKVIIYKPPFEEPSLIESFSDREAEVEPIKRWLDAVKDALGQDKRAKVVYKWRMRALTKTGAKTRARTWTRTAHPVTLDAISASHLNSDEQFHEVMTAVKL